MTRKKTGFLVSVLMALTFAFMGLMAVSCGDAGPSGVDTQVVADTPEGDISQASAKHICTVCDWVYDPAIGDPGHGIAPGTAFADLPDTWVCPDCLPGKDVFRKL